MSEFLSLTRRTGDVDRDSVQWAAVLFQDGRSFVGDTHADAREQAKNFYARTGGRAGECEEGFMTGGGRFLSKHQAAEFAQTIEVSFF